MAGDDELLAAAVAGIDRLNQQYVAAPGGGGRFYLFHRKRVWNEVPAEMDGMGAQAGKAARAEPIPARVDRHPRRVPAAGGSAARNRFRGVRYVITL